MVDLTADARPGPGAEHSGKWPSIARIVAGQILCMSVWFSSAAVLPELAEECAVGPLAQSLMAAALQAGFVIGALFSALTGIADRFDPRKVVFVAALGAALTNAAILVAAPGGATVIAARFFAGVALAMIYPIGMKLAVGWGVKDRGLLTALLLAALTLGSGAPHALALAGGADWRMVISATSLCAVAGGAVTLTSRLGPHLGRSSGFCLRAFPLLWTDRRIRYAVAGYLGHMWELYALWAWIGLAAMASFAASGAAGDADMFGKLTAFVTVAVGVFGCIGAGFIADRFGKVRTALAALVGSALAALLAAAAWSVSPHLLMAAAAVWGFFVIADSAQFSAAVADYAPKEITGCVLTLQTATGFALTILTVQATPALAQTVGWPAVMALMAVGPALGALAMLKLDRLDRAGA